VVGIRPATTVWAPGIEPLPPKPWSGRGAKPTLLRRGPGHEPVAVKALAISLAPDEYHNVTWRDGTNAALTSRFACRRIRCAHQSHLAKIVRPEEWLLIEWLPGDVEPSGYWLSTAPPDATLHQLVFVAKMRWRIERDYRELKQEFGLSQYEGRNWRGFHHHATLCIAAYGFLTAHRLTHDDSKKNSIVSEAFALPTNYLPRGRPMRPTPRAGLDQDPSLRPRTGHRQPASSMPLLRRT
jgi:SRSO17 transposase